MLERIAEERIREAIERGELDDLELAGKPLRFDPTPFVPADLRLAYKMLADAGYLPPEMELRKEIASLKDLLAAVAEGDENEEERIRLARRINDRVLRLNLLLKRSLDTEDRQVYEGKIRRKLEEKS